MFGKKKLYQTNFFQRFISVWTIFKEKQKIELITRTKRGPLKIQITKFVNEK